MLICQTHRTARDALLLLGVFVLACAAGCSRHGGLLTFQSIDNRRTYEQLFPRAVCSQTAGGEFEAVLSTERGDDSEHDTTGPISARSSEQSLQQIVRIRVLWRPVRGAKPDSPTATNAAIDWYVRQLDSSESAHLMHYEGAGFVNVYPDEKGARFIIRNATVAPKAPANLPDPLGHSMLEGDFYALRNAGMLKEVIAGLPVAPVARTTAAP